MDREIESLADRQIDGWIDRGIDRLMDGEIGIWIDRPRGV